jgi:hypothetical protein
MLSCYIGIVVSRYIGITFIRQMEDSLKMTRDIFQILALRRFCGGMRV